VKKSIKSQKHNTKIPQKEAQICRNEPQFQPFIVFNQEEIVMEFFVNGQKIEFCSNQIENFHQNYSYQEDYLSLPSFSNSWLYSCVARSTTTNQ
jgi:hypothetical protein